MHPLSLSSIAMPNRISFYVSLIMCRIKTGPGGVIVPEFLLTWEISMQIGTSSFKICVIRHMLKVMTQGIRVGMQMEAK